MNKFLRYSILFVLPIVILSIPLEIMLRTVPNPYKYKYEWMQQNAEEVETIVLGSSHSFYGIRPEYLDGKAFSLANVSQDKAQDLFLLKYWAGRYRHLKTVIYPISSYLWFTHGLEYGIESYRCRYYKIYMDYNLYPDFSLYNLELSDPKTAMGKIGKLLPGNSDLGYDEYGWGTTYRLSEKKMVKWNDGTEAEAAVKRHTAKSWEYIESNYVQLRDMACFCRDHNIQLILITTPCWHTYYDNLDKKQQAKAHELTHRLQSEFGLPHLDYMKDTRFEANDFYDSNHLSTIGAEKFTRILNEDIKRISSH